MAGVSAARRTPSGRRPRRRGASTSPTRTHASSRACAASCRATTRRPSPTSTRSFWPPRSRPSAPTSDTSSRCSTPPNASSRPPGIDEPPEVLLADAGYWHGEQMQRIVDRGIQVLIPRDTSRRRTTRRNWDGGRYDEMRQVLASERGGELYRKRQPMIEPVFAQIKFNRGLDRFRRRGRGAVRAEWRVITATHNLLKLHRHTLAAA